MLQYMRRPGAPENVTKAEPVQAKARSALKGLSFDEATTILSPSRLLAAPPTSEPGGPSSIVELLGADTLQMAAAAHLVIQETGCFQGADALPALHQEQLLAGLNSEGWGIATIKEAFEMIDEAQVIVQTITAKETGQVFTHLKLYMGDTEVGYIYEDGMNRVASVSDQEIVPSTD
jgi:hypothetical protein